MRDNIVKIRRRRIVAICLFSIGLAALVTFNALKPSQVEKDFNYLKEAMTAGHGRGEISAERRKEMRKLFEKLSPESRDKLAREVLRDRLDRMRKETRGMTEEEKTAKVDSAIKEFRGRFSKISDKERSRIKERLESPEGRERFKKTLEFYSTEFTAKERERLDPLVHEIMAAVNTL